LFTKPEKDFVVDNETTRTSSNFYKSDYSDNQSSSNLHNLNQVMIESTIDSYLWMNEYSRVKNKLILFNKQMNKEFNS